MRNPLVAVAVALVTGLVLLTILGTRSEPESLPPRSVPLDSGPAGVETPAGSSSTSSEPNSPESLRGTQELAASRVPPPFVVFGRVRSAAEDAPVAGASVRLSDHDDRDRQVETKSDELGRYRIEWEHGGVVQLLVEHPRFVNRRTDLFEAEAGECEIDHRLARGGTLSVRVVDRVGDPVAGAVVQASSSRQHFADGRSRDLRLARAATDASGQVLLYGIDPEHNVSVTTFATGFGSNRRRKVNLERTPEIVIELDRIQKVRVKIVDSHTGEWIPEADLRPAVRRDFPGRRIRADDGSIEIEVHGNLNRWTVFAPGYQRTQIRVLVTDQGYTAYENDGRATRGRETALETHVLFEDRPGSPLPLELTVMLDRGVVMHGRVVDESGAPVAGVCVRARRVDAPKNSEEGGILERARPVFSCVSETGESPRVRTDRTSVDGRFEMERLDPLMYELEASGKGFATPTPLFVDLPLDAQRCDVGEIIASRWGRITGIVVDGSGVAIPGAKIRVFAEDDSNVFIAARSDGRFKTRYLLPGRYFVRPELWGPRLENEEAIEPTSRFGADVGREQGVVVTSDGDSEITVTLR